MVGRSFRIGWLRIGGGLGGLRYSEVGLLSGGDDLENFFLIFCYGYNMWVRYWFVIVRLMMLMMMGGVKRGLCCILIC